MSLFDSNPNGPSTSGSIFGPINGISNPPTSGIFNSSTTTAQPTASGLLGYSNSAQPTSGSLFSAPTTKPVGTFGSSATPPSVTGGSLFGSSAPNGGLFGSANAVSTPALSPFNQTKNTSSGGLLAPKSAVAPAQQQADAQTQFTQLSERIERIVSAWSPDSPQNRFRHYFYNLVDPSQVQMYGRQASAHDEVLWQRAVRENPDPSCLVPVLATSFDDLQKRVDAQVQQAAFHHERISETQTRIASLSNAHALKNAPRLAQAVAAQARLAARLRALARHLHLLIPSLRSAPLSSEEEALRIRLQETESALRSGLLVGKMNELWARTNALKSASSGEYNGDHVRWTIVDEEGLALLVQILVEQQAGLTHITKILNKGLNDVRIIYGEGEGIAAEKKMDSDLLQTFSLTLRGSTGH